MKLLGQAWGKASDNEKKPYIAEAQKESARYKKEKLELAKKAPPKKPLSAYMLYLKEIRPQIVRDNSTLKSTQIVSKIAEKWVKLSEAEKIKYSNAAARAQQEYQKKYQEYQDKVAKKTVN